MDAIRWQSRPPLRQPILVAGFEGWNDAADAASGAAAWLVRTLPSALLASIDPEEFIDYQAHRPRVELADGVTRKIVWPANEFFTVMPPDADRDLVVLLGVEPNYRWRSFCAAVLDVAATIDCELVVTFGALLADVPHTRPVRITGTATEPELIRKLGLERSRYEGPTGIVGVLHEACRKAGIPSASLWAPVPHYVASPPNPVATRELLARFAELVKVPLDLSGLDSAAESWRARVDQVVAGDEDVATYVEQLEERADSGVEPEDLPSADAIAAEVERFLREQGGD